MYANLEYINILIIIAFMKKETTHSGGIGFCGLLTLIFITLKLLEKIEWSWWWVLSPLWVPAALFICFGLFCLIMAIITKQI